IGAGAGGILGAAARGIIIGEIQATAPSVATAAAISANPVTGKTAALSVLGADDGGESNLTYTWSLVPGAPASVTYSANGTNAAKNTTATFTKAGTYVFEVKITDAQGLSRIDLTT